jgi:hypothetical protein
MITKVKRSRQKNAGAYSRESERDMVAKSVSLDSSIKPNGPTPYIF